MNADVFSLFGVDLRFLRLIIWFFPDSQMRQSMNTVAVKRRRKKLLSKKESQGKHVKRFHIKKWKKRLMHALFTLCRFYMFKLIVT